MEKRGYGFLAASVVIGVSVAFGIILGGWINTPRVMLAAPKVAPMQLAPTLAAGPGISNFADIVERAMPAVVGIESTRVQEDGAVPLIEPFRRFFGGPQTPNDENHQPNQRPRVGEGSGFLISPDGYILTNNHVVDSATDVEVTLQNEKRYAATLVGADPSIDLALLKIDPDGEVLPTLPLGDSGSMRVGEWVIAIGNPLEFEYTVTVGVVSGKGRRVPIGATDVGVVSFIQTDAAINFGNSGGPLLDAHGNVVGINTAISRANLSEGIGFALPINQARGVIEQLRDQGFVRRGFIGITMNATGVDEAAREYYSLPDANGVIVDEVQKNGPAARAGVRKGDIIRKIDKDVVKDNRDLVSKIASRQPGESVALDLLRDGKRLKVEAVLQDRQEGLEARLGEGPPRPAPREAEPQESVGFGLTIENLSPTAVERLGLGSEARGVVVTDIEFTSEAADKGIAPGMLIVAINDRAIDSVRDWVRTLEGLKPGQAVKIDVLISQRGRDPISRFFYLRFGN